MFITRKMTTMKKNSMDQLIIELWRAGTTSAPEIARELDLDYRLVHHCIKRLRLKGLLK